MYGIIYKVINKINGKCYIGQTTKNLQRRKITHICSSRTKTKNYFHKAISKHGEKSFLWSMIYQCENQKQLNKKERFFISKYKTLVPFGYNLTEGGYTSPMINPSKELIKKHKKSCKRACAKLTGENNIMANPLVYDKHKIAMNNEQRCKKHSDYMKTNNPNSNPEVIKKKCKHNIFLLSPDGKEYHVKNVKKFCRENNLSYSRILYIIKNEKIHHKDWRLLRVIK